MRRTLFGCICVVGLAISANVDAGAPKKLRGAYAFTGSASCLFAPGSDPGPGNPTPGVALPNSGFNANLQPLVNATAFSVSFSVVGVRTFSANGTGTVTGTTVSTAERPTPGPTGYPSFPAAASSNTFSASFTYTVNDDDTIDVQLSGPYTGTFLSGPRTGQTFSIDTMPLTGLVSIDGKTVMLASVVPTVEIVTYSNGDVWPRICHRSRIHVKTN